MPADRPGFGRSDSGEIGGKTGNQVAEDDARSS